MIASSDLAYSAIIGILLLQLRQAKEDVVKPSQDTRSIEHLLAIDGRSCLVLFSESLTKFYLQGECIQFLV